QRLFRWTTEGQSRFIESLILEMPIPPIFVIETEENKFELIDGLQRLGSYFRFRNKYRGIEKAEQEADEKADDVEDWEDQLPHGQLVLAGCDIINQLNGMRFEDLPVSLQIKLKRVFIRVERLRKGTTHAMRYYMFKRL